MIHGRFNVEDLDEPHDRAFCWNMLCCLWTIRHKRVKRRCEK